MVFGVDWHMGLHWGRQACWSIHHHSGQLELDRAELLVVLWPWVKGAKVPVSRGTFMDRRVHEGSLFGAFVRGILLMPFF